MHEAHETEQQPLASRAAWVVGCRIVGILATLAGNVLAARLLGPAEFGAYLLVTTVMALGSVLGMAGQNEAGLRFISESLALGRFKLARAYLARVLAIAALASLAAALAVALSMALFQSQTGRFHDPALLIVLTAVGVIALSGQQIAAESLRGYHDLRLASLFSGGQTGGPISNLLFLCGLIIAALMLQTTDARVAVALVVASILLTVPIAVSALVLVSRATLSAADRTFEALPSERRNELMAVGGTLLLSQLFAFASQQIDIWLGGALLAPHDLGLYGVAKRSLLLAAMPVQMATLAVVASIPRLHAQGRFKQIERVVRGAAFWAAIPSLAALLLLTIAPGFMLQAIFGGSYAGAAPVVLVLVIGNLALVLFGNPSPVLAMTGRHRQVVAVNFAAVVALFITGTLGARLYGATGLAVGSAVSLIVQNGLLWWMARRELGVWTHVGFVAPANQAANFRPLSEPAATLEDQPVLAGCIADTTAPASAFPQ
jgi:O-antigen/teichoic acid export membrane protein